MYVDAHIHGAHAERDSEGRFIPPMMPAWRPGQEGSVEAFLSNFKSQGIEKGFCVDEVDVAFELHETFGDFVVPIPRPNMDHCTAEDVDGFFGRGARGVKFIAPMHSYGDNRYFPLYDAIRAHGGVAVFHTGYLTKDFFEPGMALGRDDYIDITHMRPAALDRIARAFPDLKILMSHFGNPWWEEAWTVLKSNKNIYADLSGGTAKRKDMSLWKALFAPNGTLHTNTVGKLCFATDGAYFLESIIGFDGMVEFHERLYDTLNVPAELRERINRGNALHLLGH